MTSARGGRGDTAQREQYWVAVVGPGGGGGGKAVLDADIGASEMAALGQAEYHHGN